MGRLAPGFVDAIVQDAEPDKVRNAAVGLYYDLHHSSGLSERLRKLQVLNWNEKALFGLIRGGSRWQLKREGGRVRGIWLRKPKTVVTLDQEVTGRLLVLVHTSSLCHRLMLS